MDPNQNSGNIENSVSAPPNIPINSKRSNLKLVILLAIVLLLGAAGGTAILVQSKISTQSTQQKSQDASQNNNSLSKNLKTGKSLIYGYWAADASVIGLLDIDTGKNSVIKTLPFNIKHITYSANKYVYYIDQTNNNDYGKELIRNNLETNSRESIKKADDTFLIDDYVVSSDGRFSSTWEISIPTGQSNLVGGKSRVYKIDSGGKTTLIYDENILPGIPIHYPLGITKNGDIFLDTFSPNTGAGWAYGMTIVKNNGEKKPIQSMGNGTYASQPILSKDESKLLFIGYDGSKGVGSEVVEGYRRALTNPNTVEIYDVEKNERKLLLNSDDDLFGSVTWGADSNTAVYSRIFKKDLKVGNFLIDVTSKLISNLPNVDDDFRYKFTISGDLFVFGRFAQNTDGLGNLSKKYESVFSGLKIINSKNEQSQLLNGKTIQLIDSVETKNIVKYIDESSSANSNQLRLGELIFKPQLAAKRQTQQSEPEIHITPPTITDAPVPTVNPQIPLKNTGQTCANLATKQCESLLGDPGNSQNQERYQACYQNWFWQFNSMGICSDSPLYLYGPDGTFLQVKSGVPLYSPNVEYSDRNGFQVTLKKGEIFAGDKLVDSIEFDYTAGTTINKPSYGIYANKAQLSEVVEFLAKKLGLNQKETTDTIKKAESLATSKFVFVSYFNQTTSKNILPLFFNPNPDNYYNVVFYIKNLDKMPVNSNSNTPFPTEKFDKRNGTTAVEISFVVE